MTFDERGVLHRVAGVIAPMSKLKGVAADKPDNVLKELQIMQALVEPTRPREEGQVSTLTPELCTLDPKLCTLNPEP